MTKLTSIVELHKAFGMSYRAAHTDFTPWFEVCRTVNPAVYAALGMLSDSCNYMSALCLFSEREYIQRTQLHLVSIARPVHAAQCRHASYAGMFSCTLAVLMTFALVVS